MVSILKVRRIIKYIITLLLILSVLTLYQNDKRFLTEKSNSKSDGSIGKFLKTDFGKLISKIVRNKIIPNSLNYCTEQLNSGFRSVSSYNDINSMLSMYGDGEQELKNVLDNKDYNEYIKYLVPATIPFLILSFITLLILLGFIFRKLCNACNCCQRRKPHNEKGILIGNYITIFLAITSIALLITSMVFTDYLDNGIISTFCSVKLIVNNFYFGKEISENQSFIGILNLSKNTKYLNSTFDNTSQSLANSFKDSDSIKNSSSQLSDLNNKIYTNNNESKLDSPNPSSPLDKINSLFITKALGPPSNNATLTGKLSSNVSFFAKTFIEALASGKDASDKLQQSSTDIKKVLNATIKLLSDFETQLYDFLISLDKNDQTVSDLVDIIEIILYVFCSVFMIGHLLVLAFYASKIIFKIEHISCMLNSAWIILLTFSFIGFLVAGILNPLSITIFNACAIGNTALNDYNYFKSLDFNADVKQRIETCLYGDGNILKEFQIDSIMPVYTGISTGIEKIFNLSVNNNAGTLVQVENATNASIKIINSYIEGTNTIPDSDLKDNSNPDISIKSFTSWTNYNQVNSSQKEIGKCNVTQDYWKYSLTKCKSDIEKASSDKGNEYKVGYPLCFQVSDFNQKGISERYKSTSSCQGGTYSEIQKFFASIKNYDISRRKVFTNVKTDIEKFNIELKRTSNTASNIVSSLKSVKDGLDTMIKMVIGPNGLLYSLNCKFIKSDSNVLLESSCVKSLVPLYYIVIFLITISSFSLIMSIFLFIKQRDFEVRRMNRERESERNNEMRLQGML